MLPAEPVPALVGRCQGLGSPHHHSIWRGVIQDFMCMLASTAAWQAWQPPSWTLNISAPAQHAHPSPFHTEQPQTLNLEPSTLSPDPGVIRGAAQYGELAYGENGKKSSANPEECQSLKGVHTQQAGPQGLRAGSRGHASWRALLTGDGLVSAGESRAYVKFDLGAVRMVRAAGSGDDRCGFFRCMCAAGPCLHVL